MKTEEIDEITRTLMFKSAPALDDIFTESVMQKVKIQASAQKKYAFSQNILLKVLAILVLAISLAFSHSYIIYAVQITVDTLIISLQLQTTLLSQFKFVWPKDLVINDIWIYPLIFTAIVILVKIMTNMPFNLRLSR